MHLEDMEACSLGGNLFNLHNRRHHLPILSFFLDPQANAWSFIREKTKGKKKKKKS